MLFNHESKYIYEFINQNHASNANQNLVLAKNQMLYKNTYNHTSLVATIKPTKPTHCDQLGGVQFGKMINKWTYFGIKSAP